MVSISSPSSPSTSCYPPSSRSSSSSDKTLVSKSRSTSPSDRKTDLRASSCHAHERTPLLPAQPSYGPNFYTEPGYLEYNSTDKGSSTSCLDKLKRQMSRVARGVSDAVNGAVNGVVHAVSTSTEIVCDPERQPILGQNGQNGINKRDDEHRTFWQTLKLILFCNWVNVLLFCVPVGIIVGFLKLDPTLVFVMNFLAIIPLAALLSFATEELSEHVGETVGGLLNATFGNAVELIVSIVALTKGEIRIVQASMLGSILSNLLLVLGMAFFFGGIRNPPEQKFNETVASTMSSLMAVAAASLIIPAAMYATLGSISSDYIKSAEKERIVLTLSRGTSIIILILYFLYLYFQLYSHHNLFAEAAKDEEHSSHHKPLSVKTSVITLILVTLGVSACAEYLVGSIDEIVEKSSISKTFIGLILIPIVGNAAEHATAVVVAIKNKMDLAVGVAVGSSMQISLLVTPFLVLLGWAIHQPMSLYFQPFETIVLFVSVLITNYLIQDGKSNYLEGAMLLGLYVIISISFFVLPDSVANKV